MNFISKPETVGIVAAGFNGGQPRGGVELGPGRMIEAGLLSQIEALGYKVSLDDKIPLTYERLMPAVPSEVDLFKTTAVPPPLKNTRYVGAVCKDVMEHVKKTCEAGQIALTLGGDHSLAMGTISGSLAVYPNVGIIWVDAHADINTPETTTSGNLHGMPLSFLTGIASHPQFEWIQKKLDFSRICYIGLRDVDPGEKLILKKYNIRAYSMHEVDRYGIGKVMDMALDYLGRDTPLHLTFDVDALDPSVAPATGILADDI